MKHFMVIEKDPRAIKAFGRWDEGKSEPERTEAEGIWSDIARLIRPQRGGFGQSDPSGRKLEKPLSSVPILAQSSFAAGIYAGLTNPANRWGGLQTPDADLNKWQPMAEWNDLATQRVLNSFSPAVSGFYASTYQIYSDLAAFGNAAAYDQIDTTQRRFIDVALSLAEVVIWIDFHGAVVEVVRKFSVSPEAAVMEFGKLAVPDKLADMALKGSQDKVVFVQHVLKNYDFEKGRLGPRGQRWLSHTACEIETSLVRVKGYAEMPFYFPRWDVDSGRKYGTGPGFTALPTARVHQQMTAATIRAAQKAADPTLLAPDLDAYPLNGVVRPGEVVYGGTNIRGEALVKPLNNFGNIQYTEQEKRQAAEEIKEVFHYSIMGLQGRTGVTSEESQIMEAARLRNWAPHADRIMEEYGARKFERRFQMLWRAGQIPPPPNEAAGLPLQVTYKTAATAALHAGEGVAVRQFVGDLGGLAQLNQSMAERIGDRIDPDALIETLHDASPNLPARFMRPREVADQIGKARAEQQQQAQQMQQMQAAGGIAKDLGAAAGALPEGALDGLAGMVQ